MTPKPSTPTKPKPISTFVYSTRPTKDGGVELMIQRHIPGDIRVAVSGKLSRMQAKKLIADLQKLVRDN